MTTDKQVVCIKFGARALEAPRTVAEIATELGQLQTEYRCVVIHGGGAEVTKLSETFGITPQFRDGIRLTTADDMHIVDMVLAGSVNTSLVRALGKRAVGLSGCDGAIFIGERISKDSHTGRVVDTDPRLLDTLTDGGWIPVISSVSVDTEGTALNINADDAALAIAESIPAESLIFISDIPGILEDGVVVRSMTPDESEDAIARGVITEGMIPKVRASAGALRAGVGSVSIGSFDAAGDIKALADGTKGTRIIR